MVNDDDDDVQTLENFYNEFTNDDLWSLITPYLDKNALIKKFPTCDWLFR